LDLNKQNNKGQTPLIKASCESKDFEIQFLIESGANIQLEDREGKSALYYTLKNSLNVVVTNLIEKGAHFHSKALEDIYDELMINYSFSECLEIFRKALMKEICETLRYTDYKAFKQRVVDSIDNEEVFAIEPNHLKAIRYFRSQIEEELKRNKNKTISEKEGERLKSFGLRERLVEDYLNVLIDKKELLEIRRLQLTHRFPQLTEQFEQNKKSQNNMPEGPRLRLKEIISEDSLEKLVESVESKETAEQQLKEFTLIVESIDKLIETITYKLKVGKELLELVESKM
jgi:hypothetical protein